MWGFTLSLGIPIQTAHAFPTWWGEPKKPCRPPVLGGLTGFPAWVLLHILGGSDGPWRAIAGGCSGGCGGYYPLPLVIS